MRDRYDVVVIGGGPAGGSAAYHAARNCLSVLLVDRATFPRNKICGDGLSPRSMRLLNAMGLRALEPSHRVIEAAEFVDPSGSDRTIQDLGMSGGGLGAVVPRRVLDNAVLRVAAEAGAVIADQTLACSLRFDRAGSVRGTNVEGRHGKGPIEGRVTIVADGASGRIGRQLRGGLASSEDAVGFAVRLYLSGVRGLRPRFEFHAPVQYRGETLVAYRWIFPVDDGVANVGLGLCGRQRPIDRAPISHVFEELLADLLMNDPRFAEAKRLGPIEGASLGPRVVNPAIVPQGALLAGDSAGLVNPYTAEGISYALESGALAAQATGDLRSMRATSAFYGRELRVRYRRHAWARDSERPFRWLVSVGVVSLLDPQARGVMRAIQDVVLDRPPPIQLAAGRTGSEGAAIDRLHAAIRRRIVSGIRSIDGLMAETVDNVLASLPARCRVPILIAGTLAGKHGLRNDAFLDSMTALTLFGIAHLVLNDAAPTMTAPNRNAPSGEDSLEPRHEPFHGEEPIRGRAAACIVIGDCLMTEAASALAQVPTDLYKLVVEAHLESTRAELDRGPDSAAATTWNGYYEALAAPAAAAATIALRTGAATASNEAECVRFARWYGATAIALDEAKSPPGGDATRRIQERFESRPAVSKRQPAALVALGDELTATGRPLSQPSHLWRGHAS